MSPVFQLEAVVEAVFGLFAAPQPTLGLAACRLFLGLVLAADAVSMIGRYEFWYSEAALRSSGPRRLPRCLDLFAWADALRIPPSVVLYISAVSASAFAVGWATKSSGVVLLMTLLAIPARNTFIIYGGDAFARTLVLLLLLSPCGQSLAVDRWWADGDLGLDARAPAFGGRLIQFEIGLLYLYNYLYKVKHPCWREGTALFDLLRNRNFARGWLPRWVKTPAVCKALTWGTLGLELMLPVALWLHPVAGVACLIAIGFHLAIALCIDVHAFSFVMVAGLVACLPVPLLGHPGSVGLPSVEPTAWSMFAVTLCLLYAAYAVFWDIPGGGVVSEKTRRVLAPVVSRLFWARGWQLFVGPCRHRHELEIVVVDQLGHLRRWNWHRLDRLVADETTTRPTSPGHRFQRFKFSLLRSKTAREALVTRFREALRCAGIRPRAFSLDMVSFDVRRPMDLDAIVSGINLRSEIGTEPSLGFDYEAALELVTHVRAPNTRATVAELILLAGLKAAMDGRARSGLKAALEGLVRVATPASGVRLSSESHDALVRIAHTVSDPTERQRFADCLTAIPKQGAPQ